MSEYGATVRSYKTTALSTCRQRVRRSQGADEKDQSKDD
jgi:hypothetical protein